MQAMIHENAEVAMLLRMANNSCLFLQALIDDIFDFTQFETGHFSLKKSWVILHEVLDEVLMI